jgi:hypothetical protein
MASRPRFGNRLRLSFVGSRLICAPVVRAFVIKRASVLCSGRMMRLLSNNCRPVSLHRMSRVRSAHACTSSVILYVKLTQTTLSYTPSSFLGRNLPLRGQEKAFGLFSDLCYVERTAAGPCLGWDILSSERLCCYRNCRQRMGGYSFTVLSSYLVLVRRQLHLGHFGIHDLKLC